MFTWFRREAPQVCAGISPQVFAENHLITQVLVLNRILWQFMRRTVA